MNSSIHSNSLFNDGICHGLKNGPLWTLSKKNINRLDVSDAVQLVYNTAKQICIYILSRKHNDMPHCFLKWLSNTSRYYLTNTSV